jgi:hypothetical protein
MEEIFYTKTRPRALFKIRNVINNKHLPKWKGILEQGHPGYG